MYILDTNTLIYFFKGMGGVPERFLTVAPNEMAIPAVVLFELEYGIAKSTAPEKRQSQLKALCSLVEVLPFGGDAARFSSMIRAELVKQGRPIGPYDLLIAGTVLAHQGTLVTHNTKEFSRVAQLKIEDWF